MKVAWSDGLEIPLASPFQSSTVQSLAAVVFSPLDLSSTPHSQCLEASVLKQRLVNTRLRVSPSNLYTLEITIHGSRTYILQARVMDRSPPKSPGIVEYAISPSTQIVLMDKPSAWRFPTIEEIKQAQFTASFVDETSRLALRTSLQSSNTVSPSRRVSKFTMLEGDTGSGKSSLVLSLADDLGLHTFIVTAGNCGLKSPEISLHQVFQAALAFQPSVVLLGRVRISTQSIEIRVILDDLELLFGKSEEHILARLQVFKAPYIA